MTGPVAVGPHAYSLDGEIYALAAGSYAPDDEASIRAAIAEVRAQIALGPPTPGPAPPSGAARSARALRRLAKADPTRALLLATGLSKK